MRKTILILTGTIAITGLSLAQGIAVPFAAEHWTPDNARVVEHAGRQAIAGMRTAVFPTYLDGRVVAFILK